MSNNFAFTEGSGKTGAAKDNGGVLYPKVILNEDDGTDTGLSAKLGSLTETAPASDTASSGLNGRLQRIAQRITSLIALFPAALTGSGNFKVAIQEAVSIAVTGTFWQATQPVSEADGANVTLGAKADAKSTATDTTAVSAMSVWKQISASVQAIATAIAGTLTVGLPSGASTSALQTTGNTSLGNIDTNAGSTSDGAATAGGTGTLSAKLRRISQGIEDLKTSIVLAAGTALLGKVSQAPDTSTIYNGTTALTPKFASIAASSSGNNTIVAAVTSKKIRVVAAQLSANAAVNAKWQSGASGTDLTGLAYLAANGGYVLPYNPVGWFETASNTLLNLNLSGAVAVGGSITYIEV